MTVAQVGVAVFSILSAFSQNFIQMLILRSIVGIFIECSTVTAPVYAVEHCPKRSRALVFALLNTAYSVGSTMITFASYFILPTFGWRVLLIFAAIPCFAFIIVLLFQSESPYYSISINDIDEANKSVNDIFEYNKTPMLEGKLVKHAAVESPRHFDWKKYFESSDNVKLAAVLVIIQTALFYTFFGFMYASPRILNEGYCTSSIRSKTANCSYSKTALFELAVSSIAELFSNFLFFVIADIAGRLYSIRSACGLAAVFSGSMLICGARMMLIVELSAVRFLNKGLFFVTSLYVNEIYPTHIRGTMQGAMQGTSRLGAILAIAMAEILININAGYFIGTVFLLYIIMTVSSFLLDKETTGAILD